MKVVTVIWSMRINVSDPETGIFARHSPFLDRYVQIGTASGRVIRVSFPQEADDDAAGEHEILDRIFDYLAGMEDDFADVSIAVTVSSDHRAILTTLRSIPYGSDETVDSLARKTPGIAADKDGHALVRETLDSNPLPLLLPDHRIRDGPSGAPPLIEQKLRSLENL